MALPISSITNGQVHCLLQVTPQQITAVIKKWRREQKLDVDDAGAVDTLVGQYTDQGCVLHYQPYRPSTATTPGQPFVIILSTPFQQRMLDQFGRRLVFMDATGGTNKYGYPFFTLLVQDDAGRGVPVAFMVSSSEAMEEVQLFLKRAAEAVSMPCCAACRAVLHACCDVLHACCAALALLLGLFSLCCLGRRAGQEGW
jgi:hypothetical protein